MVSQPTHVAANGGASLIDLVLLSNPQQLHECSVIPELPHSDHNGISVTMNWKTARDNGTKSSRPIWRYALADFPRARELLEDTNWDSILSGDVDQAWSLWHQKFLDIMEQCIPKGSLPKRKCPPWISKRMVSAIRKRNACYRRAKRTGSPMLLSRYKHLRNKVVGMVKRGKSDYLDTLKSASCKEFWKAVKNLNGRQCSIPPLNHSGKTANSDREKANMLNNYFSSCFNKCVPPIIPSSGLERLDPSACPPELLCTEDEVLELLLALDTSKANGPDNISAKMLKSTATSIAPVLTKLLNLSITTGRIPGAWKTSSVVPIPKNGNKADAKNYRPISLLSVISKVLERHIHGKILVHLQATCPLSDSQWGFCSGKSTVQALLTATNDWLHMMESGIEAGAVFFDFTKAFDSVPHKALIEKLQAIGLDGFLVQWITDYLTNRKQCVVVGGATSEFVPVVSGVPQGSVLGPLLFLIYINGIAELPLSPGSKLVIYADDVLLYRPIRQASDFQLLQQDVDALGIWADNNYLTFNPSKCKAMVFSSRRQPVPFPANFSLNGFLLEVVDSVKYLGLSISSDLSWTNHINSITSKARKLVGLLFRQFYRCADTDVIRKLYIAIVRPHLEYASQVWDPYLLKDQQTLESVQKFACRVCLKRWDLNYSTMLEDLNIPTLAARRKQLKLCTLYNYVHGLSVAPTETLSHRVPLVSSRHVHDLTLVRPFAHTNRFMYSFFPNTISLWNNLPSPIVHSNSIGTFKHSLSLYNSI